MRVFFSNQVFKMNAVGMPCLCVLIFHLWNWAVRRKLSDEFNFLYRSALHETQIKITIFLKIGLS
jgi:hypothetical protein